MMHKFILCCRFFYSILFCFFWPSNHHHSLSSIRCSITIFYWTVRYCLHI